MPEQLTDYINTGHQGDPLDAVSVDESAVPAVEHVTFGHEQPIYASYNNATPLLRADMARLSFVGSMAACRPAPRRCVAFQPLGSCTLGFCRDQAAPEKHVVS